MMAVLISPETSRLEAREGFTIILPKFLWAILEKRARVLHSGDLGKAVAEMVTEELTLWLREAVMQIVPAPSPN